MSLFNMFPRQEGEYFERRTHPSQPLVSGRQAAEGAEPCEGALDCPPPPLAALLVAVSVGYPRIVGSGWEIGSMPLRLRASRSGLLS